jgi:hypothetical protein
VLCTPASLPLPHTGVRATPTVSAPSFLAQELTIPSVDRRKERDRRCWTEHHLSRSLGSAGSGQDDHRCTRSPVAGNRGTTRCERQRTVRATGRSG